MSETVSTLASADFEHALGDGSLSVTDRTGRVHHLPGLDGFRVMEILRDFGLPIEATCGGAAACGTCHVFVDADWLGRLAPPMEEELWQLDQLRYATPASRLSCQIIWDASRLDGLALVLAPRE